MSSTSIACPACKFVNNFDLTACAQCGATLTAAKVEHTAAEIRRITEGFKQRTAPRQSFYTFNGFGTTLLDYRALADGTYEATRWVVALMLPLVPLATYIIRPETQEHSYGRETSKFTIVARGRLRLARIARTYLLAIVALLPLGLGFMNSSWVNRTLGGPLAALAMFACFAWAIYIVAFRLKNEGRAYTHRPAG